MIRKSFVSLSLLFALTFTCSIVFAQNNYRGWQVYTSFKDTRAVDFSAGKIWAASTGGLYTFDAASGSQIQTFTNLDGLRSIDLNAVYVDNSSNVWSGSLDGAISIYLQSSNSWAYITDIQTSNETNKKINHITQYGNFIFMATEFSVIKFDAIRFEISDQPYTYLGLLIDPKPPVNKLLVVDTTIWAATQRGIAFANVNRYLPIRENWYNYTMANTTVLKTNRINTVKYFAGRVIFGTDSGMVSYANSTLTRYEPLLNGQPLTSRPIIDIAVDGNSMYIATYNTYNEIYRVDASNLNEAQVFASGFGINSLEAAGGDLYIASPSYGTIKNNLNTKILPDGPNSNFFFYDEVDQNENLWAVGEGIYRFNGSTWKNFNTQSHPWIGGNLFVQLYSSPLTGIVWASGFGNGLGRIVGDSIFMFNAYNSCLQGFGGNDFVLVEGVKEDHNGKLWLINRAPIDGNPIVNFTDCVRYPPPANSNSTTFKFLAIDNYNTKWMTNHPGGDEGVGISYFNEQVPSSNSIRAEALGTDMRIVNDIIVDRNGEVWVATDNGIAILSDPYQVIRNPNTSDPGFVKMRIIANGISTPLTEHCFKIRVDALNNKWVATLANGLLYLSPDGSTILAQYNITNSPLLTNSVSSIAPDSKSGKIYFGSSKGLHSYKSVAVEPPADCDRITAGPNPYLVPNEVNLRIDGFVEGSTVKILTISGTLVTEFESPGGRVAEWDGRDQNGNLVATGIYIIAGYNKDASKVCTGKVAVVRK